MGSQPTPSRRQRLAVRKHSMSPHTVGMIAAAAVHFQLPLSFFIVRQVVEQGQCIRENTITHRAVTQVQPLSTSRARRAVGSESSTRLP